MRENCTSSLCGGRRPAQEQSSAPPPTRHSEDGRAGHMGKRSAVVELFLGDMGSIQRELRPSTQREHQLTMETKLEQIAVKAVNQLPKSVVRETGTPRSVGAGGGRPPPATRWARGNSRPYRDSGRDRVKPTRMTHYGPSQHDWLPQPS